MFDWLTRSIAKRAVRQTLAKRIKNAEDSLHRADQELRAAACETTHGEPLSPTSCVSGPFAAYVIRPCPLPAHSGTVAAESFYSNMHTAGAPLFTITRLACFTCRHYSALCHSRGSCKMLICGTMRLHPYLHA